MTHVVTEACIQCKFGDCIKVCPVDCFKQGPNMVIIDPTGCIDCTKCVPECPANAIYALADLPEDQQDFVALNAELSATWPTVTEPYDPLPDAKKWKKVKDKRHLLQR